MLRSLKDLERYTVSASDGDAGHVVNFLLDDERWVVRYLVVDTGSFISSRKVLISPISFTELDSLSQRFHLALTTERIKRSPGVDVDKSVSRQHERAHALYYGHPYYWGYIGLWGMGPYPGLLASGSNQDPPEPKDGAENAHLRSVNELRGYQVHGSDETIGHIKDFIVDDQTWQVRYLVVDTSHLWFGENVLVARHWATRVDWFSKAVYVDLTREEIKNSPKWDPSAPVNREYEAHLYDYYGRPVYWEAEEPVQGGVVLPPR